MKRFLHHLSITEAAEIIHVPVRLIERAVKLGLAMPATKGVPYRFSEDEMAGW